MRDAKADPVPDMPEHRQAPRPTHGGSRASRLTLLALGLVVAAYIVTIAATLLAGR